jgi:hypothetical protein
MAIGPVQLLVLGFQQPRFQGEILDELDRLCDNDLVRVVDALVVYKDAAGNVEGMQGSQLGAEELADAEAGATVGALVGLAPRTTRGRRTRSSQWRRPSRAVRSSARTPETPWRRSAPTARRR